MALPPKIDYCGLGSVEGLVLNDHNDNASATYLEKQGGDGAICATEMFGERKAPSNSYRLNDDVSLDDIVLGAVKTVGGKKFALKEFSVTTGGGQPPQVAASCQQIEDDPAYDPCTFTLPELTLKKWFHAQVMSGVSVLGDKCEVVSTNFKATCDIPLAEDDGEIIASDTANGKIEEQLTILQYGDTVPTVSVPDGSEWVVSAPLSCTRPDSDFPTWTVTVSRALAKDDSNDQSPSPSPTPDAS